MHVHVRITAIALLATVALADGFFEHQPGLASHTSGASAFAIDLDPAASPGNTATVLGSREPCGRINRNQTLDADEDATDSLTADVTVVQVPATNPAIGYSYTLQYDEALLTLSSAQGAFFLATTAGSSTFDASETVPDTDGNHSWTATEVDVSDPSTTNESGSGVLQRIALSGDGSAQPAVSELRVTDALHLGTDGDGYYADSTQPARLALDIACPPSDADADRVFDVDEVQCGSDPASSGSRPERVDGTFSGVDDDGDTVVDEGLPGGITLADCDGDGFSISEEAHIYSGGTPDQDPCGTAPSTAPFNTPAGWPADLAGGSFSANKVNVQDMATFVAPTRRLDASPGDANYDARWDLVPGNSGQAHHINSVDQNLLLSLKPAMLYGASAFNGPVCPWPP